MATVGALPPVGVKAQVPAAAAAEKAAVPPPTGEGGAVPPFAGRER